VHPNSPSLSQPQSPNHHFQLKRLNLSKFASHPTAISVSFFKRSLSIARFLALFCRHFRDSYRSYRPFDFGCSPSRTLPLSPSLSSFLQVRDKERRRSYLHCLINSSLSLTHHNRSLSPSSSSTFCGVVRRFSRRRAVSFLSNCARHSLSRRLIVRHSTAPFRLVNRADFHCYLFIILCSSDDCTFNRNHDRPKRLACTIHVLVRL
jgi:hypothetical protein